MLISNSIVLLTVLATQQAYAATITSSGLAPQFSPVFPGVSNSPPSGAVTSYNPGPYDTTTSLPTSRLQGFPEPWAVPPTDTPEVKAAYNKIDWSKVPKAPVRKQKSDGSWVSTSDGPSDPYCWWSSTNCLRPKVSYLPEDVFQCPKGVWGLNYDDGPFNRYTDENAAKENPYAEPALYNFLAERNLHASLFYVGSNVVNYPAAAKRGLNDGNHLCVHTYSHTPLTTQTNAQIVSEFYYTLKAIKAATGVTSKCFRPPQGDVDDRVRSIAWQMGMRNILWNADTNDWAMPAPGGGDLSPKKVDALFAGWIKDEKAGKNKEGLLVLEHELNSATVNASMFWLPHIQETFTVLPALACAGISKPYWEENFVYPTGSGAKPPTTTATSTTTKTTTTTSSTATSTSTGAICYPGSSGLGNGDGYNGYCCSDQADCLDDCLSGKCNGPVNTKTSAIPTTSTKATTTTTTTTTKATTKTTTKTTTKSPTSKPTTPAKCTGTSAGKGNGDGKTGACCKTSDDCVSVCRSGVCNI